MPHVPALDGLRGLALLGVLFFHAGGALRGGYLGVDLFFVLSGYLITSLLLAEHAATGRIALSAFWVRRARRLFPALLSLMPAIALYGWFIAKPGELAGLRADALATLGYVANWRAVLSHKSYWELFASPSPLEHTWSLAIEEQFYIVWPLVVALLLRVASRRAVLVVTIAAGALSIASMLLLFHPESVSRVYLGTDTRASGILAGAAFAALVPPTSVIAKGTARALDVAGLLAAIGLGAAWWTLDGQDPLLYHGGFWLTEGAALVLIACAVAGSASLVARALAFRPLALVGTISYGLYLWHWPIDVVLTAERVRVHGFPLQVLRLALTFAIAIVSYRFLERPIRTRGLPFGRPLVMVPAAVALAIVLVVRATHARPAPPSPPPLVDIAAALDDAGPTPPFRIMLLGDSTANSLGWGLRGLQDRGVTVELRGQDGCTMLADLCGGEVWSQHVRELRPDATIVFLGGAFLHGVTVDGRWRKSCHPGWDDKFEGYLAKRLAELTSPFGRVYASTIPYPLGPYDSADFRAEVDCINREIRKAAAAVPGVLVLDFAEELCPKGECQRELRGTVIRPDGVHYCIEGVADASRWVLTELRRASP